MIKMEVEKIENVTKFLRIFGNYTIKAKVRGVYDLENKLQVEIFKGVETSRIYVLEMGKSTFQGLFPEKFKDYIITAKYDEMREKYVLFFTPYDPKEQRW